MPDTPCKHENLLVTSTETVTQSFDRTVQEWGDVEMQTMEHLDAIECEDCGEDVTDLFDFTDGKFIAAIKEE